MTVIDGLATQAWLCRDETSARGRALALRHDIVAVEGEGSWLIRPRDGVGAFDLRVGHRGQRTSATAIPG
jgi:hypothetical protein